MVLCSCFLGQTSMCDILLSLVCALVNCPCGEYGLRTFRFQGFLARRVSVRSECRPVCCSSVGICYSFLLQYQDRRSAVVFPMQCRTRFGVCVGSPSQVSFGVL